MRHGLALVALLLPLTGCVVPAQPVGYGYGGYPQPGYPQPGYPGGEYGYPGFAYSDGSPTLAVDGAILPLIFLGGGWGYYDSYHRWHRAPEGVERHLNQRFPGGAGYRPWGGGQAGRPTGLRPEGFRPEAPRPGGYPPGGNQGAYRPAGPSPGGVRQPPVQVQRAATPQPRPAAPAPQRHREDEHH
jgi:hypothetical protein